MGQGLLDLLNGAGGAAPTVTPGAQASSLASLIPPSSFPQGAPAPTGPQLGPLAAPVPTPTPDASRIAAVAGGAAPGSLFQPGTPLPGTPGLQPPSVGANPVPSPGVLDTPPTAPGPAPVGPAPTIQEKIKNALTAARSVNNKAKNKNDLKPAPAPAPGRGLGVASGTGQTASSLTAAQKPGANFATPTLGQLINFRRQ